MPELFDSIMKGRYEFEPEYWNHISGSGKFQFSLSL